MVSGLSRSSIRSPDGSTSAPSGEPPGDWRSCDAMPKRPGFNEFSTRSSTLTGPMKW
jgi:hypothetical protein